MSPEPVAATAVPAPASDLISALRTRAPRVAMTLAAGQAAFPAARMLRGRLRERTTFTVKVPGSDELYDDLHAWVLSVLPDTQQRALVAWTSRQGMAMIASPGDSPPSAPSLKLRYDGSREQAITIGGHRVKVVVADGTGDDDGRNWKPPEIYFTAGSAAGRDAVLAQMRRVLADSQRRERKPAFRMLDKWGDWTAVHDLPGRTLDSVILPDGQLERLTGDVARFLGAEAEYVRRCIPWHRGYLFEGPPGTGKTSVARAVASHFGMDIWYLPLADVKNDSALLHTITRVGPRSMLLLEDADVFHAATVRSDGDGVTLSGLLNALDGIATPPGLVTVLTTNEPDSIDQAVMRPGRVDLHEHFGLAGPDQVARLVERWYGEPVTVPEGISGVAPAAVIEACKRSTSAAEAVAALAAGPAERIAA